MTVPPSQSSNADAVRGYPSSGVGSSDDPPLEASPAGVEAMPGPSGDGGGPSLWRRLQPHLTAVFITFHLMCVGFYLVPTPPKMDQRALNHPDVKEEVDRAVLTIQRVTGYQGSLPSLRRKVIDGIRVYTETVNGVREYIGVYLEAVGSTQSWNMFGGTPPRHPRVLMVEVGARGQGGLTLYQDGHWLTPADYAWHFRHRKMHEQLSLGGRNWEMQWLARYWARRWNRDHPDRPAETVKLSYAQLHTPDIRSVRAGKSRRPEDRVNPFLWRIPPGEQP